MARSPARSGTSRRVRAFSIALVGGLVVLGGVQAYGWIALQAVERAAQRQAEVTRLLEQIRYYDELLTMSARQAAATGDRSYVDRYHAAAPKLDSVIARTMRLVPDAAAEAAIRATDQANRALIDLEEQSFVRLAGGDGPGAYHLVTDQHYEELKRTYWNGMERALNRVRAVAGEDTRHRSREQGISIAASALAAAGMVLLWLWTQRRLEDSQRAETESRLRSTALVTSAAEAYIETDQDRRVAEWNPQAERAFGWSSEETVGRPLLDLIVPASDEPARRAWLALLDAAESGHTPPRHELVAVHRSGRTLPVEASAWASADGSRLAMLIRDVTEQREAEDALRGSEERFRTLVSRAPIGIVRLDLEGRYVDANPAFCAMVGRGPEELAGLRVAGLWQEPESSSEQAADDVASLFAGESTERYAERRFTRPDGDVRLTHVTSAVVHDGEGHPQSIVATVEDVTDRANLKEELGRARELEALGRLAGGIAHEINTPTQFVSDNLAFITEAWTAVTRVLAAGREARVALADDGVRAEVAAALAALEQEADLAYIEDELPTALGQSREGLERVASIVRAMKAFGHPDGTSLEPAELNQLIENTVTVARNELRYVADVELDLGEVPTVMCYPGALGQVVLNLLVNAAHAVGDVVADNGRLGTISVRTWHADDMVCFEVSDTGAGIPPTAAPHIFEPFFTTKPVGRGTGQGLAMAWSVVTERHGGHISFTTEVGRGTTFTVKLPVGGPTSGRRTAHGRAHALDEAGVAPA